MRLNGVIELKLGKDVMVVEAGALKSMESNEKNQLVYIFERATLVCELNKEQNQ